MEERFQKEAEEKTKNNKQEALLDELLTKAEVDLPETMIDQEVDAMLTQTAIRLSQQGLDVKKLFTKDVIPRLREQSRSEAIERIKRSVTLQKVASQESIKTSEEEINGRIQELIKEYSDSDIDPQRARSVVENEILTEKIIDWLLEKSSIELVPEGSLSTAEETESETSSETSESEETRSDSKSGRIVIPRKITSVRTHR